jgi:hypothetical protein
MSIRKLARGLWLYGAIALSACSDNGANTGAQNTTAGASGLAGTAGVAAISGMNAPIMSGSAGATATGATIAGTSAAPITSAGTAAPMTGTGPAAGGGASTAGTGTAASFTRVWNEILMLKGCSGEYCHGSGMGGLTLKNKRIAYDSLVNAPAAGPACAAKGGVRVKPGMPDMSLLLDKISHTTPSCGEIMPVGVKLAPNCVSSMPTVCTTEAELNLVRDWILAGAKDD